MNDDLHPYCEAEGCWEEAEYASSKGRHCEAHAPARVTGDVPFRDDDADVEAYWTDPDEDEDGAP